MMINNEVRVSFEDTPASLNEKESGASSPDVSNLSSSDFDYVLVFSETNRASASNYKKQLVFHGRLVVKEELSRDRDEIFLYVTTTPHDFEEVAEQIKLKKRLKLEYGGGQHTFHSHKKDKFLPEIDGDLFSSYERALMIRYLISTVANIDVDNLIDTGELNDCFPLHEPKKIEELMEKYLKHAWYRPVRSEIVHDIRDYFGSYIAIYFGWLIHYSRYLIPAAIIGAIIFILQFAIWNGPDNPMAPYYGIFIALWATIYIEFWKRRNSELVAEWEMSDFTEKEDVRPSFKGEERYGTYMNGVFVPLEGPSENTSLLKSLEFTKSQISLHSTQVPKAKYYSQNQRNIKIGTGLSIMASFAIVAVIGTLSIFVFRQFINKLTNNYGGVLGGVLNAVLIMVLNMVYRKVAKILTNWENHRTQQEFEYSLIIKNFLFQFVNSYVSLFYIAFVKGNVNLFGYKDRDQCTPNCMQELETQLATVFLTQIFVQNFTEVGIPYIKQKIEIYRENRKIEKETHSHNLIELPQGEEESKMDVYESTFDDYNEMAIQFGYVTLFAVAFPLAPLAAFFNNVIEAKTDLLKLVKGMQRPTPKEAADIGPWLRILEFISYTAVVTNCAIIVWTSDALDSYIGDRSDINGNAEAELWHANYTRLIIGLILEHVVLLAKFVISEMIPDVPKWVKEKSAKKEYYKQLFLEDAVKKRRHGRGQVVNNETQAQQEEESPIVKLE